MKVFFVQGTTASGKSEYALQQAAKTRAAIINCDSIQVYEGLKIGSALPSAQDFKLVPHYLYSYVAKGSQLTAGEFARDFYALMKKIEGQFSEVYVVGGTGFYFQAIEKGMFLVAKPNMELRKKFEQQLATEQGAKTLYEEFRNKDPEAAKKIFANDHYRLARAMELMCSEGKTLTQIKNEFAQNTMKFPWELKKIAIEKSKEELLRAVHSRTKKMLQLGLVEEVRSLIDAGYLQWKPLQSVGYKEACLFLQTKKTEQDFKNLESEIIQNTMKLIKKQRTWFKRDSQIEWITVPKSSKD